jgi:hypothetical protein
VCLEHPASISNQRRTFAAKPRDIPLHAFDDIRTSMQRMATFIPTQQ